MSNFKVGDRVAVKDYGNGIVREVDSSDDTYRVYFDDESRHWCFDAQMTLLASAELNARLEHAIRLITAFADWQNVRLDDRGRLIVEAQEWLRGLG